MEHRAVQYRKKLPFQGGSRVKSFLDSLRSMRLALWLIGYLAITGILATLVPQGEEAAVYTSRYGRLFGEIIVQTGFSRFFRSILFYLPAFAFFINLSFCTLHRLLRELRKKAKKRHGPDILHLGLMLLVVGSVVSFSSRQEGAVRLAEGDKVELPGGRVLELTDFSYSTYEDGRPQDWTSTVRLSKDGTVERENYAIRVNHPLRIGRLAIYQSSHAIESSLAVTGSSGKEFFLGQGQSITDQDAELYFMAADDGAGKMVFRLRAAASTPAPTAIQGMTDAPKPGEVLRVAAGDKVGPFTIIGLKQQDLTGLQAVLDPGYPLILAALIIALVGLGLTFIQKLGDIQP